MNESQRIWRELGLHRLFNNTNPPVAPIVQATPPESLFHDFEASLPAPLLFYWQKVVHPVSIVWTYAELDLDHRWEPDSERMALWDSIMKAKCWLKTQVAFWPLILHENAPPFTAGCASYFRRFIKLTRPVCILCFGSRCHGLLKNLGPFSSASDSLRTLFLPGPEEMLPDNKLAKKETWRQIQPLVL